MSLFTPTYQAMTAGVLTELGIWLNPGARVVFVHHSGGRAGDIDEIRTRTYSTLNSALLHCRSGMGDTVVVLEGHAENITTADQMSNLVAGTRILGLGTGVNRPAFTWTASGSTFLLDVAGASIENCRLFLAGPHAAGSALTVTAPITVSAAGCAIKGCQIFGGFDGDQKVTIGITTTAAATDFIFDGNDLVSEIAAECTTMIQFVGADRLRFTNNTVTAATSAVGVGVVRFLTTTSLNILMLNNRIQNTKAVSETAVTGMANMTGMVDHLWLGVLDDAAGNLVLSDAASAFETPAGLQFGANVFVTNLAAETAAKMTAVSA
jgi:hypothetical protein